MEWDNLVWKATAAYNFFPTESSGIAPFFLMFGQEAAVKHTLLESENPKYLGTNDSMINVGLMTKLYNVVAHNLNEARKARDGKRKGITPKEPEKLKIGDNILVRDHTSKAFQPKYKDFCIVGLLGKNQVEIKDNHGHITKVHHRDVKKIPMTEKVCKIYRRRTNRKNEGRKKSSTNQQDARPRMGHSRNTVNPGKPKREQPKPDNPPTNTNHDNHLDNSHLEAADNTKKIAKRTVQAMENTIKKASHNKLVQNIKDFHRTTMLAITVVTNMTIRTNHSGQAQINRGNTQNSPGT